MSDTKATHITADGESTVTGVMAASEGDLPPVRLGFKMQMFAGFAAEYQKRHDEIWPDLVSWLKENGISDYSIFLDETTNSLFGVLRVEKEANMAAVPNSEVMQRWWAYMKDVMESNADGSPVSIALKEVFYMP